MFLAKIVLIVWESPVVTFRRVVASHCFQALLADAVRECLGVSPSWDKIGETGTGEEASYVALLVTDFAIGSGLVKLPAFKLCLV